MKNIAWIEEQIKTISNFLAEDELRLKQTPDSFALRLVVRNKQQHLDTLRHELLLAQAERNNEVMELRLRAQHLERGDIPLRMLAKLAEPLHRLIAGAAYHIRHGRDANRGIPTEWTNELDLRLAGIGYGSTRLFITGKVSPDLAGDSALQDSLAAIFGLLNAGPGEFYEATHRAGKTATSGLTEFLRELEREHSSAEFSWTSPTQERLTWQGSSDKIIALRASLEAFAEQAEITLERVSGTVTLLAVTGRIELISAETGQKIKISYPKARQDWVAGISLHQQIFAQVEKTTWFDPAVDRSVSTYELVEPIK